MLLTNLTRIITIIIAMIITVIEMAIAAITPAVILEGSTLVSTFGLTPMMNCLLAIPFRLWNSHWNSALVSALWMISSLVRPSAVEIIVYLEESLLVISSDRES